MVNIITKSILYCLCFYLLYFLVFGIITYAFPKKVSTDFIDNNPIKKYYGSETETMLVIHSTEFNKVMRDEINKYFTKSLTIDKNNNNYIDDTNIDEIEVPTIKKVIANLIYPILYLFKYLI